MKGPDQTSKKTQRRKNRGFKTLELSCRKHKRAARRTAQKCTIDDVVHKPGAKVDGSLKGGKLQSFLYTAGGSINYH